MKNPQIVLFVINRKLTFSGWWIYPKYTYRNVTYVVGMHVYNQNKPNYGNVTTIPRMNWYIRYTYGNVTFVVRTHVFIQNKHNYRNVINIVRMTIYKMKLLFSGCLVVSKLKIVAHLGLHMFMVGFCDHTCVSLLVNCI